MWYWVSQRRFSIIRKLWIVRNSGQSSCYPILFSLFTCEVQEILDLMVYMELLLQTSYWKSGRKGLITSSTMVIITMSLVDVNSEKNKSEEMWLIYLKTLILWHANINICNSPKIIILEENGGTLSRKREIRLVFTRVTDPGKSFLPRKI